MIVEMERRREPRVPVEIQVRIAGVDAHGELFAQNAVARSLSPSGALITGIEYTLRCGDGLFVEQNRCQAKFKVVWIRNGQAAVQKFKDEPCPWGELLAVRSGVST